jgi:hypothetical protein
MLICYINREKSARLIGDSIMLNENLAVGADKCGNVFGLLCDKGNNNMY